MGQKVNPISLRIGITRSWPSTWFVSNKNKYKDYLHEDLKIRTHVKKKFFQAFHLDITNPTRISLANQFEMRPDDIVFVATQPLSLYSRTLSQILGSTGLTLQARDTIRTEIGN